MGIGVVPECSWWFTSFSWLDWTGAVGAGGSDVLRQLADTGAGVIIFGGAAWFFWMLARRRWDLR